MDGAAFYEKMAEEATAEAASIPGEGQRDPNEHRFPLTRLAHIKPDARRRYIVDNLIPRDGLIVVWGPPKCAKTFLVLDLALHVALGWPYRGRRVEAGTVVYITCEGQAGFPARIEAFRRRKKAMVLTHLSICCRRASTLLARWMR